MRSIKEILTENDPTPWSGSEATYLAVKSQIEQRWGKKVSEAFRPSHDARTFNEWLKRKFIVNKGEEGLKSFVVIERKNEKGGVKKIPKKIWLFHRKQVSKMK